MNNPLPEDLRAALEELLLHSGSSVAQPEHVDEILHLCEAAALAALPEKLSEEYKTWIDGMMDKPASYKNNGMTVQFAKGNNKAIATAQANIHSVFGGSDGLQ